jgi:hypothetical protein
MTIPLPRNCFRRWNEWSGHTSANGLQYVAILQKAAVFEIREFDLRAAVELSLMTANAIKSGSKRSGRTEPYQLIKIDRQIVTLLAVG